jgi:MHS family proline/betaine transporter-like MFS transporter
MAALTIESTPVDRSHSRRVVIGGTAGQALEFFDYALDGSLAVQIGGTFFPTGNKSTELLAGFAVFGAAFVARPFGGIVFGRMGDRIGRRAVLVASVTMISLCTFAVGLIPSVKSIGILAPILVVLLRLLQGVSAGGEGSGVFTFVSEHAPYNRRGLYTGWVQSGSASSFLLSSLVIAIVGAILPSRAFDEWGWRIPFLLALPLGIGAILIRLKLEESPVFNAMKFSGEREMAPVRAAFRTAWRKIIQGTGIAAIVFVGNYTFLAYLPTFVGEFGYSSTQVDLARFVSPAILVVCYPIVGFLSDRFGRKQLAMLGMCLMALFAWPLFAIMTIVPFAGGLACIAVFGFIVCMVVGPSVTFMVEALPARVRMTSFATGYNVGSALFGGTAVFIAAFFTSTTGDLRSVSYYLILAALISLLAIATVKDFARSGESVDR